jgi:hypothetical protein
MPNIGGSGRGDPDRYFFPSHRRWIYVRQAGPIPVPKKPWSRLRMRKSRQVQDDGGFVGGICKIKHAFPRISPSPGVGGNVPLAAVCSMLMVLPPKSIPPLWHLKETPSEGGLRTLGWRRHPRYFSGRAGASISATAGLAVLACGMGARRRRLVVVAFAVRTA